MTPPLFCLASGRSGTHFLYELLRRNTRGGVCRHEPYLWNPSMFGRAIYDHAVGDTARLRSLAQRKRRVIERYARSAAYVETSHAFLKSWADLAIEFFPRMKLIHLVRNPLAVALSEAIREELLLRWHVPFCKYRGGDGQTYFRWSLTGLEPIFAHVANRQLSRFQWYVVQWIEIENRAMSFLQRRDNQADCFTLHSPLELNNPAAIEALLNFTELPRRSSTLILKGRKNRTPGVATAITSQHEHDLAAVVRWLPTSYLEIFKQSPYSDWDWSAHLRKT